MSFVTFVRDYIQDPDRIIHVPNFIFDVCKDFIWYIFSFQWFRNLIYVTPSFPTYLRSGSFEQTSNAKISSATEGILNEISTLSDSTNLTYGNFELPQLEIPIFHNSFYGFFNGITSTFHFCAVTILVIHVLLNENKSRAFKIALASCFGDVSYMVAVLLGFTGIVIPWLSLEPLSYILGFSIQFFFALEIIKDNRRIKANFDKQFRAPSNSRPQVGETEAAYSRYVRSPLQSKARNNLSEQAGFLSFNRWLIPSRFI